MSRVFTLHSALGESLKFSSYDGTEQLSRMFDGTLTGASLDNGIALNALLGKDVTIEVELQDRSKRFFNANVSEFKQVRRHGRYHLYELRLRPKAWFLSLTNDFRVYQKMSGLDIVKSIYSEFGILIKDQTTGRYPVLDYTVLYGESYLDFCMRLQEKEGIGFYFEHAMGSHTLVLFDSVNVLSTLPGHASIPYYPPDMAAIPDEEFVSALNAGKTVNSGKVATGEYDFKGPKAYLDVNQPNPREHEQNRHEVYEYPGHYRNLGEGENYGRIAIEVLQANHERCDGETNARGFAVGYRFTLTKCPRKDQNREYVIEIAQHHWTDNSYEGGANAQVVLHDTRFTIRPSSEPYRPERLTPRPVAYATEVAIVTGPPGQEIWTDTHGRVKLHFPWDRRGPKDQNSSCWVRVATPWAGSQFGAVHIPRIGQEVVVAYVNNNPDHPLVISRVYNADNLPPWDLPANATQSGILTRSSKGGGYNNANALRFEDKKGEEQLWLHAEKDQLTEVEHDEDKWIGNDRRKTIDRDETNHIKRDRTETVDRDETITVHGKRTEVVDGNEDITIHSNRKERVDQNEKISIGKNRDEDVGQSETIDIGDDQKITVGSNRTKTVKSSEDTNIGKTKSDTIGKSWSINVGMMKNEMVGMMDNQLVGIAKTITVGMAKMLNVGMTYVQNIGQSMTTNVGKTLRIEAGDSIEIVCGQTKIKMTKDGTIAVTGKKINISAVGDNVEINGKEVFINPPGGTAATTADPSLGGEAGKDSADAEGDGTPPGASGFAAGGANSIPGMSGDGMGMGGLAGIAKSAAGLAKAAGSIPGLGGKAGAAAGLVGGMLGGGSSGAPAPGPVGLGDGKPGNF